ELAAPAPAEFEVDRRPGDRLDAQPGAAAAGELAVAVLFAVVQADLAEVAGLLGDPLAMAGRLERVARARAVVDEQPAGAAGQGVVADHVGAGAADRDRPEQPNPAAQPVDVDIDPELQLAQGAHRAG